MSDKLHARRLNHGQSEVWLGDDGPRRTIATNALLLAAARECDHETFATFYATLHAEVGNVVEVADASKMMIQALDLAR